MFGNYLKINSNGSSSGSGRPGQRYSAQQSKATASTKCQKCLGMGHFTADCKGQRQYAVRPTRTQILKNPKLATKLTASLPPPLEPKEGTAAAILAANEAKRAKLLLEKKQAEAEASRGRTRSRRERSVVLEVEVAVEVQVSLEIEVEVSRPHVGSEPQPILDPFPLALPLSLSFALSFALAPSEVSSPSSLGGRLEVQIALEVEVSKLEQEQELVEEHLAPTVLRNAAGTAHRLLAEERSQWPAQEARLQSFSERAVETLKQQIKEAKKEAKMYVEEHPDQIKQIRSLEKEVEGLRNRLEAMVEHEGHAIDSHLPPSSTSNRAPQVLVTQASLGTSGHGPGRFAAQYGSATSARLAAQVAELQSRLGW
ncbi:hypothetical protein JCM10212_000629 [Sporobolomyces blumeae]